MKIPRKNPLVHFAVERRVTMVMIVVGLLVLGWLSLERLPLEYLPSFSSSSVSVNVSYPSSSPGEVERLIARPLEDSLSTINGIETLSSSASADSANVNLNFLDGTDMELAVVEVRDRIDRARQHLPSGIDRINIRRFQSTDIPVLRFHVAADWPEDRLYTFIEEILQRRLERLDGVAQVQVRGARSTELQVLLDTGRMRAHGVDVRQLATVLRANHVNVSGGEIDQGSRRLLVRSVGELASVGEVRDLPINDRGLRLGDVAEVRYGYPDKEEYNFLNGREALTVRIYKASTANLLAVVDQVKAELAAIEALPDTEGLEMRIYADASVDVRAGVQQLRQAGLIGGGLAVLAVFLFLRRPRTTLLVAMAIPISVVFTFVIIYLLRQAGWSEMTLNVVSLTGLVLALGMLVDSSIVVIESIFRHRQELGEDPKTAALKGASEVALPIVASTVTTMCVFLPVIFLASGGGGFNFYMKEVGVIVCIVMVASLLVSLTLVPMVAVVLLRPGHHEPVHTMGWMARAYGWCLRRTLRHRLVFVVVIFGLLWGSWQLFAGIERTFSGRTVARQVTVEVDTPPNYSLVQTREVFTEVVGLLQEHREALDIADIAYEFSTGNGRSRGGRSGKRFDIYLKDEAESDQTTVEIRDAIRALMPEKAGVKFQIGQSQGHHGGGGIEVQLSGDDPEILRLLANRVAGQLRTLPLIRDVDTSLESGTDEIRVTVDRERTLQAGLSTQMVANTIRNALSSRPVSRFKAADRELDMVMQYRPEDRETLAQLKNLPVFVTGADGQGAAVPLSTLADMDQAPGPRTIERENRRAKVTVTANTTDPRAAFAAMGMVRGTLDGMSLPPGYEWSFGRWNRRQMADSDSSWFSLLFALLLVYMLMAALFESFTQPFTIMFAVPFAFIGVGVVMTLFGQPRDNMTDIGLIILAGVVVNNAIVLVDHINRLRGEGLSRHDAIVLGGQHRLRPILMTAMTTILGLTPMVAPFLAPGLFGPVEGRSAEWAPVGLVILGGLTTSTFLTVLIVPTIYSMVDDLARFSRRVARAVWRPARAKAELVEEG